jgi:nucleolar protein 58
MLVLFESSSGYALFKVLDEGKLEKVDNIYKEFKTPERAAGLVKLHQFKKFENTTEAMQAAVAIVDGKLDKNLKKLLKHSAKGDVLGVADSKLGNIVKEKLSIDCINNEKSAELIRGIRSQFEALVTEVTSDDNKAYSLGLAHGLSRYKLKFSPDKVDTMIVQAINLLDELDKEINIYAMRVREWYGWHFPEMGKIVTDNLQYAQCILKMGTRDKASKEDFSDILSEDIEKEMKEVAEVSMGTEIGEIDVLNIKALAEQVQSMMEYRVQLFDYLKSRMNAIAPNLTVMVGELVGARLLAHAGSLLNLAKQPASTVQILGAEKALFRALKTKHDTPKYGLIYHASLIGQTATKNKGKISRVLAAKTALAIRVDALGDTEEATIGLEGRAKVEERMRQLESRGSGASSGNGKTQTNYKAYDKKSNGSSSSYNASSDAVLAKRKRDDLSSSSDSDEEVEKKKKKKKSKKEKKEKRKAEEMDGGSDDGSEDAPKKKKAKSEKKKKKKSEKKKKKKKSSSISDSD